MKTWKMAAAALFFAVLLVAGCNGGSSSGVNITGTVSVGGNALAGVTLTFSHNNATVTTDAAGNFSYTVTSGTSTTVTPTLAGYSFAPGSQAFVNLTTAQVQNFIATLIPTTVTISGMITDGTNALAGVTVTFSHNGATATTDGAGNYTYTVDSGTTTTVTATMTGYTFAPASLTLTNVTANQADQDFTGTATTPPTILSGTVSNNYNDLSVDNRGVAGATVILVKDEDVEGVESISPVEDLVNAANTYPSVTTDADGMYEFKSTDFSATYPENGNYFVYVEPPAASDAFWPGGSASRERVSLDGTTPVEQDVMLTDKNGSDATYIGSSTCLFCHPKNGLKQTLHFVGIRKIGANGTVTNGRMNMDDTSVYDLAANNTEAIDKFTDPATKYTFANNTSESFWLGKDATGLYFQLTSNTNPKFYVKYSYGGETGIWKMRFMTTVYDASGTAASGTYAPEHGASGTDDYAYYVMSPIQYQEDEGSVNGGKFVTYHDDRWDFAGTGNNGFTADPELKSFDLGCAACHGATQIKTQADGRMVAVYPANNFDPDAYVIDGVKAEINIGCEKCHGPGSNHLIAGGQGHAITVPDQLPAGRLTMICGNCHIRGENHTNIGGEAALIADGTGNYDIFKPGMSPSDFFGTPDMTSAGIVPFGTAEIDALTTGAYLEPINYETLGSKSWIDIAYESDNPFVNIFTNPDGSPVTRTQVTDSFNHSKGHHQQFMDVVRTKMYKNDREIVTCIGCHNAHGSSYEHQAESNVDDNSVCLACHNGTEMRQPASGDVDNPDPKEGKHTANFQYITQAMVADLAENGISDPAIGKEVMRHIGTWANGQMGASEYDPTGANKMGRCTNCHMPKTAKSADLTLALLTNQGLNQYTEGDIHSHTFDVMSTEAINAMETDKGPAGTTPSGMSDSCAYCHPFAGLN
ncbi:MAG: hypothetical protein GXP53_06085 [Deltaproteobacteria bacterium]|nr:hypothetical protein [Deltaproteobacteria bacterium]